MTTMYGAWWITKFARRTVTSGSIKTFLQGVQMTKGPKEKIKGKSLIVRKILWSKKTLQKEEFDLEK